MASGRYFNFQEFSLAQRLACLKNRVDQCTNFVVDSFSIFYPVYELENWNNAAISDRFVIARAAVL